MLPKVSRGFSIFGFRESSSDINKDGQSAGSLKKELAPSLKLHTDKEVYRPGDLVIASVEISNQHSTNESSEIEHGTHSFLVESLKFEIKGIEKLDTQWFATQKPLPGSKQKRGEQIFLDCSTPSIISKVIISSGYAKTYTLRAELPKIIPPSYRGSAIRYLYYARTTLIGHWLVLENGRSNRESLKHLTQLEERAPLQIWVTEKSSGLLAEEGQTNGILPVTSVQMDIYWKEKDADTDWQVRANEVSDVLEDGYDSSRDEISSVSSYNPTKGNIEPAFRNYLSLQSSTPRISNAEAPYIHGERSNSTSYMTPPKLSVAEVSYDPDVLSPNKKLVHPASILSTKQQRRDSNSQFTQDEAGVTFIPGNIDPVSSEGFIRGRSYNIKMDDQVLLRFSPKSLDSTYYFGDVIGGTLTFFQEGARRCLEISITLETSETINQHYIHPSRRNSTTITKVQSDHYEIVADLLQTSFLFSIPVDGPMSFSTPHISVQWSLRFEFFTTPGYVDWTRYEHPLLIDGRDKSEWVLPITVHAPPLQTQSVQSRNEKPLPPGALWIHT